MTGMRLPASGTEWLFIIFSMVGALASLVFAVSAVFWGLSYLSGLSVIAILRSLGLVYVGICIGALGMVYAQKREEKENE